MRKIIIAGWLVVFAGWLVGIVRDRAPARRAVDNPWRCRPYGITAATILLATALDRHRPSPRRGPSQVLLLVFLSGVALYYWARASLGRNWSSEARIAAEHRLVTEGAYRLVRHPIYLSKVLMALSAGLMLGSRLVTGLGVVLAAAGLYQARVEEALLRAHFADQYAAYARRTPMFVPFRWPAL